MLTCIKNFNSPIITLKNIQNNNNLLYKKGDEILLEDTIPLKICPLAYYNLLPYIFTLHKGGWFGWVKRTNNINYRKQINKKDFFNKNTNRLYPNEVLVQCPNPNISILFGVGIQVSDNKNFIKIRVLNSKSNCPCGHKVNDNFIFDPGISKLSLTALNTILSSSIFYALRNNIEVLSFKTVSKNNNLQFDLSKTSVRLNKNKCSELCDYIAYNNQYSLSVKKLHQPCRYHKFPHSYTSSDIIPSGMCPELFHSAYIYSLNMLYNNTAAAENIKIDCSSVSNNVSINIFAEPLQSLLPDFLKKLINSLLNIFNKRIDFLKYKIFYTVDTVINNCPMNHSPGQKFEFNLSKTDILCPSAMHSTYPYFLSKQSNSNIDWEPDTTNSNTVVCPDCVGAVYSIKKDV